MKSISSIASILRKKLIFQGRLHTFRNQNSIQGASSHKKKVDDLFLDSEVQRILKKITGLDYDKIFAQKKMKITPYKYEFATEKRLKELQNMVASKVVEKLQMPPVMEVRKPINEVLSKDPELQGYLRNKLLFIDTSPDISPRDRIVTVRELDGTLRKASWEERERMNQIFFPIPGRNLEVPELFKSPHLERILDEGSYMFILDITCVQFEPDDPEYHRITKATYEHIKQMKKFDILRSTRHFGPMAFYFAYNKNIDPLLKDMIEKQLISDASYTVKLFYILHPDVESSITLDETNEVEFLQAYIKNHSTETADLELRLQTFLELQQLHLQEEVAA